MANRVAVFNAAGSSNSIRLVSFMQAQTPLVARFVGSANVVASELARRLTADADAFAIRAENVREHRRRRRRSIACEGVVVDVQYHGATSRWQVRLDDGRVRGVPRRRRRTERL